MRESLLNEGVVPKFLRYVQVNTQSDEKGSGVPSTPGQWDLARLLEDELQALGLENVAVDAHCIVTATLPGNKRAPTLGLLAHMDTSASVSGKGVKPLIHPDFSGQLRLPAGPVLDVESDPVLGRVIGYTLITSDGSTLLGADDKAGVAEIMEAICTFLRQPELPHGPIRIAFTPDEEIGRGISKLDVAAFRADVAYTLDGAELGEFSDENFNAVNLQLKVVGRSAHTGSAKGSMINAVAIASQFVSSVPSHMRAETTAGREGFIHVDELAGTVEQAEATILLRDFSAVGLAEKEAFVQATCVALEKAYPGSKVTAKKRRGYVNMKDFVNRDRRVVDYLRQAMLDVGVEPLPRSIRGGTDGADLSARGLPTPNMFVGGGGFHSRTEWVSVEWMQKAVDTVVQLAQHWSGV